MRIPLIEQNIKQKIAENQKVLDEVKEIKDVEGTLFVRRKKGVVYYYSRSDKASNGEYLSKSRISEIQELETKNYNKLLRQIAEENIKQYKKAETAISKTVEIDTVFSGIAQEKRHLIQPYCLDKVDEGYAKEWASKDWHKGVEHSKGFYRVSNGILVRSKSELIIAEKLIASGIPFYYEQPVTVDYAYVNYPDFLVLNKRTKQEYYWEHFGLISDPKYCANVQEKLETYARNNIVLGKNLIISMESSEHPLDTEYVDKMIEQYLK